MMGRAFRLFDRFWFAKQPATRLALLRIIIGSYALYDVTDRFNAFLRNTQTNPSLFDPVGPVAILSAPLEPSVFQALLVITVVLNVLFLLGWGHRLVGPLFGFALLWVLSYRNSWSMIFHTDNLLALHVLILGLTRSADALSLDALRRMPSSDRWPQLLKGWSLRVPPPDWQYGYAIRLLCLVTTLTYFISGMAKLLGPLGASWGVGESLRSQIAYDVWRKELLVADPPTLIFGLYEQLWLFTALGIGTFVIELGAPLAVLSGWIAALWIPSAYLMHQGIAQLMGIEFPYQLSGVAFAPFVPLNRVLSSCHTAGVALFKSVLEPIRPPSVSKSGAGHLR
jgi:hypothetical protein